MIGLPLNDGFIDLALTDFNCPYCGILYMDFDNKYLNRCNSNKSGYTRIKCVCGQTFGMTYNFMSEAIGFKIINS